MEDAKDEILKFIANKKKKDKKKQIQDADKKVSNDQSGLRRDRTKRTKKAKEINKRLRRTTTKDCL